MGVVPTAGLRAVVALAVGSAGRRARAPAFRGPIPGVAALWAAIAIAIPATAPAQTWDAGGGNTNWSTATNWDPNGVPTAAGDVVINSGALALQPTLNVASAPLNSVTVSSGTLTVDNTLTAVTVTVTGTGNLTINVGDTIVTGSLTVGSTGTLLNNGTIQGPLTINNGTVNNAGVVTGATTINAGTLNLNPGTNLSGTAALTINGGTVTVNASDTVGSVAGTGGTLQGTATLTIAGTYNHAGNILSGLTVNAAGTKTLTGIMAGTLGGAGATILQGGAVWGTVNGNTTVVAPGGSVSGTINGDVTVAAGTLGLTGSVNGDVEIEALGRLVGGPAATITGDVTNYGAFRPNGLTIFGDLWTADPLSQLFGRPGSLVVTGTATLGGQLNFDPSGLTFDQDYLEAEVFRADDIIDNFAAFDLSGPANYAVGTRIEDVGDFSRYLITYTRRSEVPEPSTLALAALGLIGCFATGLRRRTS